MSIYVVKCNDSVECVHQGNEISVEEKLRDLESNLYKEYTRQNLCPIQLYMWAWYEINDHNISDIS